MSSRRAFTLVELLVVVGIMGLLGTISVGGYRAMRRGMEEKGVMQNVNTFLRAAYQRAQIDRLPTAVFLWNEAVRVRSDDDNEIVVGKAVAVRRAGRISAKSGQLLIDEFADLDKAYPSDEDGGGENKNNTLFLYPLDNLSQLKSSSAKLLRSTVEGRVYSDSTQPTYMSDEGLNNNNPKRNNGKSKPKSLASEKVTAYAFKIIGSDDVPWKPGMAYGFEFANIVLPHGYIFGPNAPGKNQNDIITEAGVIVYYVGEINVSGNISNSETPKSVKVYSMRPGSNGLLSPQPVGDSLDPSKKL